MNVIICEQKNNNKEKFGKNGSRGTEMRQENFNMNMSY